MKGFHGLSDATSNATPADMPGKAADESAPPTPDGTTDGPSSVDELPKWAQDEIRRVRDEAAKYRQRAKQAGDDEWYQRATKAVEELDRIENERKTEAERLAEQLNDAKTRATDAERNAARLRAAMRAGFSGDEVDDIASRLRGDSADELEADAKALRERFAPKRQGPAPDPSQGNASAAPLNGDPLADMLRNSLRK